MYCKENPTGTTSNISSVESSLSKAIETVTLNVFRCFEQHLEDINILKRVVNQAIE